MRSGIHRTLPILLLIALASCPIFAEETTISGKITGFKSVIPSAMDVRYTTYGSSGFEKLASADKKGFFTMTVPDDVPGELYVAGVDHHWLSMTVIPKKGVNIQCEIRMAPQLFKTTFDEVKIMGNWNKFDFDPSKESEFLDKFSRMRPRESADSMEKMPDGSFRFRAKIAPGTYGYQLFGITNDAEPSNGFDADKYLFAGRSSYLSFVKTDSGELQIVFDPKKIAHYDTKAQASVVFKPSDKRHESLWNIENRVNQQIRKFMIEMASGGPAKDAASAEAEGWANLVAYLSKEFESNADATVRQYAGLTLANLYQNLASQLGKLQSEQAEAILAAIPPESVIWNVAPGIPQFLMTSAGKKDSKEALQRFVDKNADRTVQAHALTGLCQIAASAGDLNGQRKHYTLLQEKYADIRDIQYQMQALNPDNKIQIGREIPDFEITLLDSKEKISKSTLKGKYCLIDFWATWCKPCVGEMGKLHEAYEKFKNKNFKLLSLSFDVKASDIASFRAKKWKMPWDHAFVEGGFSNTLAQTFEVMGIPRPILIGPDGKILAMDEDLRGAALETTLTKYVK